MRISSKAEWALGAIWNTIVMGILLGGGVWRTTAFDTASFAPRFDFPADSGQAVVAFEDLDGDGKIDAVAGNFNSRSVSVYRNTSTKGVIDESSFAPRVTFTVGGVPHQVLLADVDGDKKKDMVCINQATSEISLFRNTATAGALDNNSFAPEVVLVTPPDPRWAVLRDLDGDGKPDLVLACWSGSAIVLQNNSTPGEFSFGPRVILPVSGSIGHIEAGDIDGDGKIDIVVPAATTPVVWIFRNQSGGGVLTRSSFAPRVTWPGHSANVTLADVDGDNKLDLVTVDESKQTVSVWRNTSVPGAIGANSFASRMDFPTGGYPYLATVAKLDGDSRADIVIANAESHTISVFRNVSNPGSFTFGSLAPRVDYPTGQGPRVVAIVDIDGDGLPDIANANLSEPIFSVFRQMPPPAPAVCTLAPERSTNILGQVHGITARVTTNGTAVIGALVNFVITSGPNFSTSGSSPVRSGGKAIFNYTGNGEAGTDIIQATGEINGASFTCVATQVWVSRRF